MQREISKKPTIPALNKEQIDLLTSLCFLEDNAMEKSDLDTVFLFGTSISLDKAAEVILQLVRKPTVKKLILTGGCPTYNDSYKIVNAESELLYDIISKDVPSHIEVCLETKSNNCQENVSNSLSFLQDSNSIALVTKNFGMGRHYLTFRKFFPGKKISYQSFEPLYPESELYITKDNWFNHKEHISRVWGEYLRIKSYGERGDIEFEEVKSLIESIATY